MKGARRALVALACALVALAGALVAARFLLPATRVLVVWMPLEGAEQAAAETGRPILYDFTAEWCGPCKRLEREVFSDRRRAAMINERFVPVRVRDLELEKGENPPAIAALRQRYKVDSFPTLLVTSAQGEPIDRASGFRSGRETLRMLRASLDKADAAARDARVKD